LPLALWLIWDAVAFALRHPGFIWDPL
jgi:hypothetical protein